MTKRKYKEVDYDQVLESVKRQRASGQSQLLRVKKLSKKNKKSREDALLKSHREAWERMHAKLVSAKVSCQTEVEMWKSKALESGDEELKAFVLESTYFESQLYKERLEFEQNTVEPLWSLHTDLKGWLESGSCPEEEDRTVLNREDILSQLQLVKEQQKRIREILEAEYEMIQSDIHQVSCEYLPDESSGCVALVAGGIPQEARDLTCPDPRLKEQALEEFLSVDSYYMSLLEQLEHSHKQRLRYM